MKCKTCKLKLLAVIATWGLTITANAQQKGSEIDKKYSEKYREILPGQKVAKLYLGEEKFRREQIHRWHRDGDGPKGKNNK